jgi:hypothetical protein
MSIGRSTDAVSVKVPIRGWRERFWEDPISFCLCEVGSLYAEVARGGVEPRIVGGFLAVLGSGRARSTSGGAILAPRLVCYCLSAVFRGAVCGRCNSVRRARASGRGLAGARAARRIRLRTWALGDADSSPVSAGNLQLEVWPAGGGRAARSPGFGGKCIDQGLDGREGIARG